jgi:hypothetical protein
LEYYSSKEARGKEDSGFPRKSGSCKQRKAPSNTSCQMAFLFNQKTGLSGCSNMEDRKAISSTHLFQKNTRHVVEYKLEVTMAVTLIIEHNFISGKCQLCIHSAFDSKLWAYESNPAGIPLFKYAIHLISLFKYSVHNSTW